MRHKATTQEDRAAGVEYSEPWLVIEVRPLPGYRLRVRFADGTDGIVDASRMILGPRPGVFEALRDPVRFEAVHVEAGAVTWPGELDLAPDAMYDGIRAGGGVYVIR